MGDKRVSGDAKKVRGSITEALGKLTGDKALENKGADQKREAEAELKASDLKKLRSKNLHNNLPVLERVIG